MPAFVESQLNDKDAADLTAYFASLPKPAAPGKWRFEVPANAPPGQRVALTVGCAQCHGPALNGQLNQIFFWMRDELGFRPLMAGALTKGEQGANGVAYNLTVANNGIQGKGLTAEGVTVSLIVPKDANVVAATGTGYQGTSTANNNTTAVWKLPRSAPKDQERMSITLSKAGTSADNLRGN